MTISDIQDQSKAFLSRIPADAFIVLVLILSASATFGLGYLAGRGAPAAGGTGSGIWVENLAAASSSEAAAVLGAGPTPVDPAVLAAQSASGAYVASRTGKKYYLSTCAGAKRITDANKMTFATKAEAEAKGYTPASNCPGL